MKLTVGFFYLCFLHFAVSLATHTRKATAALGYKLWLARPACASFLYWQGGRLTLGLLDLGEPVGLLDRAAQAWRLWPIGGDMDGSLLPRMRDFLAGLAQLCGRASDRPGF